MSDKTAGETRTPFTLSVPEFDENTYWGRFEAFRATANPLLAFFTNDRIKKMQRSIQMLEAMEMAHTKMATLSMTCLCRCQRQQLQLQLLAWRHHTWHQSWSNLPWSHQFWYQAKASRHMAR